jgi:predicted N-acetyltransferase YhbS
MTTDEWVSGALTRDHDVSKFDCGVSSLNDWLRQQAMRAQEAGTARTFAWIAPATQEVRAYFSIAPTQVARTEVSGAMAGGYNVIPSFLLAKLALDLPLQGGGLGEELLHDALARLVEAANRGGGRLIVVDAIDEKAATFYARYDFRAIRDNPLRLVMKVATARSVLGIGTMSLSSDAAAGLTSLTLTHPDGTVSPFVADNDEMHRVAERMIEILRERVARGESNIQIDMVQVIRDVLGRDPFKE